MNQLSIVNFVYQEKKVFRNLSCFVEEQGEENDLNQFEENQNIGR